MVFDVPLFFNPCFDTTLYPCTALYIDISNSPNDVVLLFHSKGGWNQVGGAEILTLCEQRKNKCTIILFNGKTVKLVSKDKVLDLNWGEEK